MLPYARIWGVIQRDGYEEVQGYCLKTPFWYWAVVRQRRNHLVEAVLLHSYVYVYRNVHTAGLLYTRNHIAEAVLVCAYVYT